MVVGRKAESLYSLLVRQVPLFLCLVYSFVPYETDREGAAVIYRTVVAVALSVFLGLNFSIKFRRSAISFFLLIFLVSALALLVTFSYRFFVFSVVIVLSFLLASNVVFEEKFRCDFTRVLEIFLILSSCAVIFQFVYWRFTGIVAEIHELVYPWSSARVEDHGAFARLGGMYIEPGTFSNWTLFFVLIYKFIDKNSRSFIVIFSSAAMIVSMSMWGMLAGVVTIFIEMMSIKKNRFFLAVSYSFVFLILASFFISDDMISFLQVKSELESESGDSKVMAYSEFLNIAGEIFFLGQGFAPGFCGNCLSPQDAGVFISSAVVFGIVFSVAVFLLLLFSTYRRLGVVSAMLIFFLPLSKVFYWEPVFWLFISICWFSLSLMNSSFKAESSRPNF